MKIIDCLKKVIEALIVAILAWYQQRLPLGVQVLYLILTALIVLGWVVGAIKKLNAKRSN